MNLILTIARPRARTLLCWATLLLLPFLLFLPAVLLRGVFYIHDVQYYFYPYHAVPAALLGQGELPLWNPTTFSGIPLIGDGQTALFYPPNWLFFFLPVDVALTYVTVLQFVIAGVGTYAFLRDLSLRRDAALVGAVAFMFCGYMTARVVQLSILAGAALVPLVFFCLQRAFRIGGRKWFAWSALAVALQAVCGHPQAAVYTAVAVLLFALAIAWEKSRADGDRSWLWRLPVRLGGIYGFGYVIAAIQLLPWIELARHSPRAAGASYDFVFGNSATPYDWLLWLFPYAFGALQTGLFAEQAIEPKLGSPLWEHSIYVGILPLALAALTVWQVLDLLRRRRQPRADNIFDAPTTPSAPTGPELSPQHRTIAIYFSGLVLLAMALASGRYTPLSHLLYLTPVLGKLRDVERFMIWAEFGVAVLAALGMHSLTVATPSMTKGGPGPGPSLRKALAVVAGLAIVVPVVLIAALNLPSVSARLRPNLVEHFQLARANVWVPLTLLLVTAALFLWLRGRPTDPRVRGVMVGLTVLDLGLYAAAFNPVAEPDLYRKPPEVLQALTSDAPFRKATFLKTNHIENQAAKENLAVSWGMPFGVQDINGFNSLQPRRYTDYLFGAQVEDVSYGQLEDRRLLRRESPILSSLNVKYLLVPVNLRPRMSPQFRLHYENDEVRVYENQLAYPRAYFVDQVQLNRDAKAILQTVTADNFDGRKLALVESDDPTHAPPAAAPDAAAPPSVTLGRWGANEQRLTATTSAPKLLLTSEMYFPGWQAFIDGKEVALLRANYLFRAVVVPTGSHEVVFRYRPLSVRMGAALTGVGLLVAIGLLAFRRRSAPAG